MLRVCSHSASLKHSIPASFYLWLMGEALSRSAMPQAGAMSSPPWFLLNMEPSSQPYWHEGTDSRQPELLRAVSVSLARATFVFDRSGAKRMSCCVLMPK